jgi:hypothetical protein
MIAGRLPQRVDLDSALPSCHQSVRRKPCVNDSTALQLRCNSADCQCGLLEVDPSRMREHEFKEELDYVPIGLTFQGALDAPGPRAWPTVMKRGGVHRDHSLTTVKDISYREKPSHGRPAPSHVQRYQLQHLQHTSIESTWQLRTLVRNFYQTCVSKTFKASSSVVGERGPRQEEPQDRASVEGF